MASAGSGGFGGRSFWSALASAGIVEEVGTEPIFGDGYRLNMWLQRLPGKSGKLTWRTAWFGTPTLLSDRWPVALQVQDLFLEAKGHYRRRGGLPLLVEVGPSMFTQGPCQTPAVCVWPSQLLTWRGA